LAAINNEINCPNTPLKNINDPIIKIEVFTIGTKIVAKITPK
jgi:hypothetical protein